MKNFNIFVVIMVGFTKNQYIGGGLAKKGGLGQFADLGGGGLGKKEGGEGDTPMHTMFL